MKMIQKISIPQSGSTIREFSETNQPSEVLTYSLIFGFNGRSIYYIDRSYVTSMCAAFSSWRQFSRIFH